MSYRFLDTYESLSCNLKSIVMEYGNNGQDTNQTNPHCTVHQLRLIATLAAAIEETDLQIGFCIGNNIYVGVQLSQVDCPILDLIVRQTGPLASLSGFTTSVELSSFVTRGFV
jgi:hypothetical protein